MTVGMFFWAWVFLEGDYRPDGRMSQEMSGPRFRFRRPRRRLNETGPYTRGAASFRLHLTVLRSTGKPRGRTVWAGRAVRAEPTRPRQCSTGQFRQGAWLLLETSGVDTTSGDAHARPQVGWRALVGAKASLMLGHARGRCSGWDMETLVRRRRRSEIC